jgi:4a-hydroxytetrahydrobiopterin dehydratase
VADRLTSQEFGDRYDLPGWRIVDDGIEAWWRASSFTDAGAFVAEIAALADAANHHPDLSLGYPGRVHVRLMSHDAGGLTDRDGSLGAQISEAAAARGVEADWQDGG